MEPERLPLAPNFTVVEFVPKWMWDLFGNDCKVVISPWIQKTAQFVRDYFGKPVKINDWWWGGRLNYRGYRPPDCDVGAVNSMHKKSLAIDLNVKGMSSDEVYEAILSDQSVFYSNGISRMENKEYATTWTHLDARAHNNRLTVFKP